MVDPHRYSLSQEPSPAATHPVTIPTATRSHRSRSPGAAGDDRVRRCRSRTPTTRGSRRRRCSSTTTSMGALRAATIIDLAHGHRVPRPPHVRRRRPRRVVPPRRRPSQSRAVPRDLRAHRGGAHHPEAIERVAAECAEDLAADGVVYAESRLAPEEVVHADPTGRLSDGRRDRRDAPRVSTPGPTSASSCGLIVCAMRNRLTEQRRRCGAAVRNRDHGVVGFDIAGPEAGFPPGRAPRGLRHRPRRWAGHHHPRRRGRRHRFDPRSAPTAVRTARPRRAHRRRGRVRR
jgi:hypothetical protein